MSKKKKYSYVSKDGSKTVEAILFVGTTQNYDDIIDFGLPSDRWMPGPMLGYCIHLTPHTKSKKIVHTVNKGEYIVKEKLENNITNFYPMSKKEFKKKFVRQ